VLDNRRVVWVFSKRFGLFELVERDHSPTGSGAATDQGAASEPPHPGCP
jgi:hypothetical protein